MVEEERVISDFRSTKLFKILINFKAFINLNDFFLSENFLLFFNVNDIKLPASDICFWTNSFCDKLFRYGQKTLSTKLFFSG